MIVQDFYIPEYDWKVRVYYAVTTYWKYEILHELKRIGCRGEQLERAARDLSEGNPDTGLTYSDFYGRETLMVISLTSTPEQFQNSWDHEKGICADISHRRSGLPRLGRRRSTLAGMWARKCFRWRRNSFVNIAEII
ncbi:MAG: hypothetical protein ACLR8S_11710 [Paraprevotella clara]